MNVKDLRPILEQLRGLCAAAGAKTAEKDLSKLTQALKFYEDVPIAELALRIQPSSKARGKAPSGGTSAREDCVEKYLKQLSDAGTNRSAFEQAFKGLISDSQIRLLEAGAIARGYTRYASKYKTKLAAFADIEKVFFERARFENKLQAVR